MIDWNDNAKAAVKNYDEWLNEPDNSLSDRPLDEFMDARLPTQTKTVADAVEQESEKWTHVYRNNGCRVIHQEKFNAWIEIKGSGERIVGISELRKPKPPISESELLDKIRERAISIDDDDEFGAKVRAWINEYDII